MGYIISVLTGRATNPAALAELTPNTGDTFAVQSYGEGVTPVLENVWSQQATAGFLRVRSPRFHDSTQAIRLVTPAAAPRALLPLGLEQPLKQTDELTFEIQGGGAEVDAAAMLIAYQNVGSGAGRFAMWEQIRGLIRSVLTVQVDVAGPVTSGDWSAGTTITNFTDLLHADTMYAILGYTLDAASLAVAIRGPDTGNYRVGGPGIVSPDETRSWFKDLSLKHGTPHIPIFNSNNKGGTQAFVAKVGAGGTVNVAFILAELASNPG